MELNHYKDQEIKNLKRDILSYPNWCPESIPTESQWLNIETYNPRRKTS
jgi:hypothetical protein